MDIIGAIIGLLGVIATIGAVYFGYFLSERANREREKETERKQAQAVRTILSLEIEENVRVVEKLISKFAENKHPKSDEEESIRLIALASDLIESPAPELSSRILESQLQFLPIALTENQIRNTYVFYKSTYTIIQMREALFLLRQQANHNRATHSDRNAPFGPYDPFRINAPKYLRDLENLLQEIITNGNPLQEKN